MLLCTRNPVRLATEHIVSLFLKKLLGGWIRSRILFTKAVLNKWMLSALSNLSTGGISHHIPCLASSLIWQSFPENSYQLRSHRQEGAGKIYLVCDSPSAWPEMGTQLHGPAETRLSPALFSPPADTQGSLLLFLEQSADKRAWESSWCRCLLWPPCLLAASAQQAFTTSGSGLVFLHSSVVWHLHVQTHAGWRLFTHYCVACRVCMETQVMEA